MSILGYSSSYFLPQYWSETPLYGEKIIPLIDYILSTDFVGADKLANAFYNMENKYKNTGNLPIDRIEAIIDESGYGYVRNLLGNDEESLRLLVYLIVLLHQLKGTGVGIETVLNLLKKSGSTMLFGVIGNPTINASDEVSDITSTDYIRYSDFSVDSDPFDLLFQIKTGVLGEDQCIASSNDYGFALSVTSNGGITLSLGSNKVSWNIANRVPSTYTLVPNTRYFLKLSFSGYDYSLSISVDGKKYSNILNIESTESLGIHKGFLYVGVDGAGSGIVDPFKGFINLSTIAVRVDDISVKQWFENTPVTTENTFSVKAELDLGVVSTDFFRKFSDFVKRYVYPSLESFEAKVGLDAHLTIIPYTRQKIKFIYANEDSISEFYMVRNQEDTDWEMFELSNGEAFRVPY